MKLTIGLLVVLSIVVIGCSGSDSYDAPTPIPDIPIPINSGSLNISEQIEGKFNELKDEIKDEIRDIVKDDETSNSNGLAEIEKVGFTDDFTEYDEPPETANWIFPGKVKVDNFYKGAKAEYPVTIHNGNDEPANFNAKVKPTYLTDDGITISMLNEWVTLKDYAMTVEARSNKNIIVVLNIKDYNDPLDRWEFYVCVSEDTGTNVITELCSKCEVTMR